MARVAAIALSSVFAVAFGLACGGRTAALSGGAGVEEGTSSGSSSGGVSSTSGSSGGLSSSGSSSGDDLDATPAEDVSISPPACGQDVDTYGASSALASCWSCIEKGCGMQLYGCSQDCSCNSTITKALACTNGDPGNDEGCFMSAITGDSLATAFVNCLATTANECGCDMSATEDASSACVMSGSGSSGGSGECTSDFGEVCGGKMYKVVCSCPQAQCVCFGDTTTIIPIDSCPLCPGLDDPGTTEASLIAACGFPH